MNKATNDPKDDNTSPNQANLFDHKQGGSKKVSTSNTYKYTVGGRVNAAQLQKMAFENPNPIPYLPFLGRSGFFVKGWSHILAAYPKTGKTELITAACYDWLQREEKILYFTEEPQGVWMERLKKYPSKYWGNLNFFFAIGTEAGLIRKLIEEGDETLIVIDTARHILGLDNENDNSEVARMLTPIIAASRIKDKTIIFLHHNRKGTGENGRAIAGAHAFLGAVDIAIELDRDPRSPKTSRRYLHGNGRINKVPELLYEMTEEHHFEIIGDPSLTELENVKKRILNVLNYEWTNSTDILNLLENPKPSDEQARRALLELANEQHIERDPNINLPPKPGRTYLWRKKQSSNNITPALEDTS